MGNALALVVSDEEINGFDLAPRTTLRLFFVQFIDSQKGTQGQKWSVCRSNDSFFLELSAFMINQISKINYQVWRHWWLSLHNVHLWMQIFRGFRSRSGYTTTKSSPGRYTGLREPLDMLKWLDGKQFARNRGIMFGYLKTFFWIFLLYISQIESQFTMVVLWMKV